MYVDEVGTSNRVTASGATVLTSGAAILYGVYVPAVLTGQIVQLWTQTAASITGAPIIGTATLFSSTFSSFPRDCPLGITYCVTNEDVDLTIFWKPAGGRT